MALFKAIRSLTATLLTTPVGTNVAPVSVINQATVVYTDSAPGNTLVIQALLTDGVTWATIQSITTAASGIVNLVGKFLDLRVSCTGHTVSGTIIADIFAGD